MIFLDFFQTGLCLIARLHLFRQLNLFLRRQQVNLTDLLEVHAHRVINRKALCERLGVLELLLRNLFNCVFGEFLFIIQRNDQRLGALDFYAGLIQILIQLIQLIRLHADRVQRIGHFLQRELALFLTQRQQILNNGLLLYIHVHVLCHSLSLQKCN